MRGDPSLSALLQNHTPAAWREREREDNSESVTNFHTVRFVIKVLRVIIGKANYCEHKLPSLPRVLCAYTLVGCVWMSGAALLSLKAVERKQRKVKLASTERLKANTAFRRERLVCMTATEGGGSDKRLHTDQWALTSSSLVYNQSHCMLEGHQIEHEASII